MKTNQKIKLLIATIFACSTATALCAGVSLIQIPALENDFINEGRAITPDGAYVVGPSSGFNWFPSNPNETNRSFIYEVGSGISRNILSSDNAQGINVSGVGYRTSGGNTEIIVAGMSSGFVTEWMTADGGVTWGPKRRDVSWTSNVQPAFNSVGAGLGSDAYYVLSWKNQNGASVYLGQGTGPWVATLAWGPGKGITSTDSSRMNGISASGRAVGWRINGGLRKNYMLTWTSIVATPTAVYFNGLDGTQAGQAFSVSADGNTIFGHSPTLADASNNYGYKVVDPGAAQTIVALPLFGDETGSTSRQVPYGASPDGEYACGMAYRGREKAVLWDTSASDSAVWTVTDLTALAQANGLLGEFTGSLRRAYSMGTNASGDPVATGYGVTAEGRVRAFLMTVPKWVAAIGFPRGQTVTFGTDVTFTAITNGVDSLTFQWIKNGLPVTDGNGISGANTRSLSLVNVSCPGGQAGNYNLVVSNLTLSTVVTGSVAVLTVLDPEITTQPAGAAYWVGETASFTVAAQASTAITGYQWRLGTANLVDGVQPSGAVVSGATTPSLTISNLATNQAGNITAMVTASCSATSSVAQLIVYQPPRITAVQPYTEGMGGWTVTFTGPQGKLWYLLSSPDLTQPMAFWPTVDGGAAQGTFGAGPMTYTNITSELQLFYRVLSY